MCKQEVIRWDKIVQKNGVSNKEDPEMKKINFTNVEKTMKREQKYVLLVIVKTKVTPTKQKAFPDWNLLDVLDVRLGNAVASKLESIQTI